MEFYYSSGGRTDPDFLYKFIVKEVTNKMWTWCQNYPGGSFERWHVIRNYKIGTDRGDDRPEIPLIQFETAKAAYMFRIAFSEYIIEDRTYSFAQEWKK